MSTLTSPTLAVAGLYAALLGRAPEAGGFTFWHQATSNGASTSKLAETFLSTPEGLATFPAGQTDQQFVTRFYTSVFGRAPDPEGLAFWTNALTSQGASSSLAARATLVLQILDVVSAQLTAKPADLNETAYLQTIADRARFANQAEFGVYFATDLKSNDVNLAKSALALITDNPATLATARQFAANGGIRPEPEPSLALTRADSVSDIVAKFAAYPGAAATVDATGMSAAQLAAVAAGNTKIAKDGITKLTLPLGDALIVDAAVTALLSKTCAAKVDATGADAARLALLDGMLDKVADDGITGTLALDNSLSALQLTRLAGVKTALAADVQVNASGMDAGKLAALATVADKLDGIASPALVLADAAITDTVALALLAKASGATVVATGASAAELAGLATRIANTAVDGITGDLPLTSARNPGELAALLGTKTALAANVQVDASGMNGEQLAAIAGGIAKVDGIGALALQLGDANIGDTITAALLSKSTAATVIATGTTAAELDALVTYVGNLAVDGITGDLALSSAQSAAVLTPLLGAKTAAAANVTVDATGMGSAQLAAIAGGIAKVDTLQNLTALALGDAAITNTVTAALLANTRGATVVATGASSAEVGSMQTYLGNIADAGITGDLVIDTSVPAFMLAALFSKYAGVTARVDTSDMSQDQLQAVANASAKISVGGIGSLRLLLGNAAMTDTVSASLLAKADNASVTATGATMAELATLATHADNVADITGDLFLSSAQNAATLTALLGTKTAAAANVTVDAAGMDSAQLAAVGGGIVKVDTLQNLSALALGDTAITDAVTTALLAKASASTVVATSASPAELAALVTYSANLAPDGITGDLSLSRDQTVADLAALLGTKTSTAANVSVNAGNMDFAQLVAVAAGQAKVDTVSNLSELRLSHPDITDAVTVALLSKASAATVMATAASTVELAALITYSARIAPGGITGDVWLNNIWTSAELTALLGDRIAPSALVSVNATGMSNEQLAAVGMSYSRVDSISSLVNLALNDAAITDAVTLGLLSRATGATVVTTGATASEMASVSANLGMIAAGGLSGTLPLTSGIAAPQINNLFEKYVDTAATVNASGMSGTQIMSIVGNLVRVATDGITGTLVINRFPSAQQITDLLGVRTAAAADVEIDASGMEMTQLNAVLTGIAKVDRITNLSLNLNSWSDANIASLLSKARGATVQTGGAATEQFDAWATYIANIADGGLSGPLSMTDTQLATMTSSTLNTKLSGTPALSVTGGSDNSVIDVSGLSRPVTVRGGAGADTITLGSGRDTVVIGSTAETRSAAFSVNDTTTDNIDRIIGMVDQEYLQFSKTPNAFGNGITLTSSYDNSIAYRVDYLDVNVGVGSFQAVYNAINAEPDLRQSHDTSTNTQLSMYKVQVTSQSGLSGAFLILNDHNGLVDGNDLIISLAGMPRNDQPNFILG